MIFIDDFTELWIKLNQRGYKFIVSKFNLRGKSRTISAFADDFEHANWWLIPYIKQAINFKISGDLNIDYENYITSKYLKNNEEGATLISMGCGAGSHELKLAKLNPSIKIKGYDISQSLIEIANKKASDEGLKNVQFVREDVYGLNFEKESIDYFLFNASLHHFKNIKEFIGSKINPALKKGGIIFINEYVGPNRLNFSDGQIEYCNKCLCEIISKENRRILGLNEYKSRCYRLGKLRMLISDPSECVDSEAILPVLRGQFEELELKNTGGNILMPVLKHIAHHFIDKNAVELMALISKEEEYLKSHASDFVFGVYQKK